ncbi:RNA-binding (RRM/RBD/RNP motifs) family protein [Striga hermonthica]|uniref:RNA-binding (RRM/RBD/RNP motifs) family protein n=1 Tax=Striga hermonthica TaxID=68872 RepID=A0A9N7NKL5_STRHE|nr:RNA-binding (RRM/RBD/RNP motifs) family protein [Striga hermonthica]
MAKILSFHPYSSPTPFSNKTHHRLSISSNINASNNSNLPLASKIIVRNLSFSTSQSHLVSEFSKYGRIAEVKLVEDKATKKPKGYAFIQYTSQEEAMLALESMDHQFFDGRTLFVDIAKPRKSDFGDYPKASGPPQEHMVIEGANND